MYTTYASIKYPTEDSMSNIGDNKDTDERVLFLQSFQIYCAFDLQQMFFFPNLLVCSSNYMGSKVCARAFNCSNESV